MPNRRNFLEILGASTGVFAGFTAACSQAQAAPHVSRAKSSAEPKPANHLRLALMQAIPEATNQARNLAKAESYCREAADNGADILLMPEMWNIGYRGFGVFDTETTQNWQSQAIDVAGPWVSRLSDLARELDLAIGATYLQKWPEKPRNSLTLIDRHGKIVLTYAKVHTCDFAFEAALTPGEGWSAVDLDTSVGNVKVGLMICFDREFPESARSLMLAGAEVVLTPNACLLDDLRIAQFQVRAYENSMAMAMTNYPVPQNNGRSVVFDAAGKKLVEAAENEQLCFADIDLGELRKYRNNSLWGNSWRRPHRYQTLTHKVELREFHRKDAYGEDFDPLKR